MEKTRNEFIEECTQIINSKNSIDEINEALTLKFDEIMDKKGCSEITKLIKQLEKKTDVDLSGLKLRTMVQKKL